jgi:hypothetical protein
VILIPKYKDLQLGTRSRLILPTGFCGTFKLEVMCPDGRVRLCREFPNLITDNGADLLGSDTSGFVSNCSVGTGNTTPAAGDTALVTKLATIGSPATTSTSSSVSPYFGQISCIYTFAQGAVVGNVAEVGVGSASDGTSLFSRALVVDSDGSATTITVTSDDILKVTYVLRQYAPVDDVTGTVDIGGTTYDYTARALGVTGVNWQLANVGPGLDTSGGSRCAVGNGGLVTVTTADIASPSSTTVVSNAAYVASSSQQDATATWGIALGNVSGGVTVARFNRGRSSLFTGRGSFQVGFDPAIPKDNTKSLSLTHRLSWTVNSPS